MKRLYEIDQVHLVSRLSKKDLLNLFSNEFEPPPKLIFFKKAKRSTRPFQVLEYYPGGCIIKRTHLEHYDIAAGEFFPVSLFPDYLFQMRVSYFESQDGLVILLISEIPQVIFYLLIGISVSAIIMAIILQQFLVVILILAISVFLYLNFRKKVKKDFESFKPKFMNLVEAEEQD